MKPLRLGISPRAKTQLARIRRWSREHGHLERFETELARVTALLQDNPEAGHAYGDEHRRVLMPRTQRYLYYRVDHNNSVLWLVAFWHTSRGRTPRL